MAGHYRRDRSRGPGRGSFDRSSHHSLRSAIVGLAADRLQRLRSLLRLRLAR